MNPHQSYRAANWFSGFDSWLHVGRGRWVVFVMLVIVSSLAGCRRPDRDQAKNPNVPLESPTEAGSPGENGFEGSAGSAASRTASTEDSAASVSTQALVKRLRATMEEQNLQDADRLLKRLEKQDAPAASRWREQIQRQKVARQSLASLITGLASREEDTYRSAEEELRSRSVEARPLVLKTIRSSGSPVASGRSMRLAAELYPGRETMSRLVEVLESPDRRENWSHAVQAIRELGGGGAGPRLLALAASAPDTRQQAAALRALADVDDPPSQTFLVLLPTVFENRPDTDLRLRAMAKAALQHGQVDLENRRGLAVRFLTSEVQQQLDDLPDFLRAKMQRQDTLFHRQTAAAAQQLATILGIERPPALAGVKVASFSQQVENSPVSGLLDGVWDETEPATMWQHAIDEPGEVVLDLGENRTVTGIQIWNLNQAGEPGRGWKEIEIAVGDSPGLPTAIHQAVVPQAPGRAGSADYSTYVPLAFAEGRYITLRALGVWNRDSHSGLSEVRVFGY